MIRVLPLAVLLSSAALANSPQAPPAVKSGTSPKAAKPIVPKGWTLHMEKEGGFQVALPRKPTVRRTSMPTDAGPAEFTAWVVSRHVDELAVGLIRRPPGVAGISTEDPASELQSLIDDLTKSFQATLQSDKTLRVEGAARGPSSYGAREFEMLLPEDVRVITRLIHAGDRLIQISYSYTGKPNGDFRRMVDSFSFL